MRTMEVDGVKYVAVDDANGYVTENLEAVCEKIMDDTDGFAFKTWEAMGEWLTENYGVTDDDTEPNEDILRELLGSKTIDALRSGGATQQKADANECHVQIKSGDETYKLVAHRMVDDKGNDFMQVKHTSPNGNNMLHIGPAGLVLMPSYRGLAQQRHGHVRATWAEGHVLTPDGDGQQPINDSLLKELQATAMWSGETVQLTAVGYGVEEKDTLAEAAAELLSKVEQEV